VKRTLPQQIRDHHKQHAIEPTGNKQSTTNACAFVCREAFSAEPLWKTTCLLALRSDCGPLQNNLFYCHCCLILLRRELFTDSNFQTSNLNVLKVGLCLVQQYFFYVKERSVTVLQFNLERLGLSHVGSLFQLYSWFDRLHNTSDANILSLKSTEG
jgi:hypothetical protein